MFARVESDQHAVSAAAVRAVQGWEQLLGLRISLQKGLDVANQLPAFNMDGLLEEEEEAAAFDEAKEAISANLETTISQLAFPSSGKKRKVDILDDPEGAWDKIYKQQRSSEDNWKGVLNKWHARYHFGSELAKSKMKVFNKSLWDQVHKLAPFPHSKSH